MQQLRVSLFIGLLSACVTPGESGSGVAKEEVRELPPFQTVELGGALNAKIVIADAPQRVVVRGDDNLVPLVTTEVKGGRLLVRTTRAVRPKVELMLTVNVAQLDGLSLSGAGNAEVDGIKGEVFKASLSGAGKLTARGSTRRFDLDVSGSGEVSARDLKAEAVTVQVSGAGNVDVSASAKLDVTISGAATVTYTGDPPDLQQHISGAGSLKKR